MGPVTPKPNRPVAVPKDRLDSWKEIAGFLDRDVRTVQRWERDWALPVHRLPGGPKAGVYAFRSELEAWLAARTTEVTEDGAQAVQADLPMVVPAPPVRRKLRTWCIALVGIVVLVLAAVWYARSLLQNPKVFLAESRFTPFATSLQVQVCPAWSPDGKTMAFVGRVGGTGRLMVQGLDSSTPMPITGPEVAVNDDPIWCRAPFWSPDSQWLFFIGRAGGRQGLLRVAALGGEPTFVQSGVISATVSRDGNSLVFLASSGHGPRLYVASPPEADRKPLPRDPLHINAFANLPMLAFSPDGTKILFSISAEHENQYWLLPWPDGEPRRIFSKAERAIAGPAVSWLADSRHLAAAAGLMAIGDTSTGRYWPIASQDRPMGSPTASPDGKRVAYQSSLSHPDVIAMPLGPGEPRTLLGSSAIEQMPDASPVNSEVVYITNKRKPNEVWIMSLAEGWDRPIITHQQPPRVAGEDAQLYLAPEFSPDGKKIAFSAISPRGAAIMTMFTTGGAPVSVADSGRSPTWSPDGNWIAFSRFVDGKLFLAKVRVGSGEAPIDLARSCMSFLPEWSPSGDWIAFADPNCKPMLISPDGKQTRPLEGAAGVMAWSRDGKTLYRISSTGTITATDVTAGTDRVVREVRDQIPYSGPQPGLRASVSLDGRSLIYSVLRPREEIWILEDVRIDEPWYARLLSPVVR